MFDKFVCFVKKYLKQIVVSLLVLLFVCCLLAGCQGFANINGNENQMILTSVKEGVK